MKLYKYRPLNEFLFKELYYQELYFASYLELNDTLDLSARIEFTPTGVEAIKNLVYLIFKTSLKLDAPFSDLEIQNNRDLQKFSQDEDAKKHLAILLHEALLECKNNSSFISLENLEEILSDLPASVGFKIDIPLLISEIRRLMRKFLENSSVTCFSEENNDFLMWSHYSSKHSGVCLEFSLDKYSMFPYRMASKRKLNKEEYLKSISEWQIEERIYWDRLTPLAYQEEQPYINFFDFFPMFDNEDDCDVMGLSKGWTHHYAEMIESCFSNKTLPWKYEKEWRAIHINFQPEEPEERIHHYPIECLSGIYFGMRTPENVKKRIYKILSALQKDIKYFECRPSNGRELTFSEWDYDEILR
jgi:hypothetical protein